MSNNNTTTFTRDLWSFAEKQIQKIKPIQPVVLKNQLTNNNNKSMQAVFARGKKIITTLMPPGQKQILQTSKDVPNSVGLLNLYAQKMGFLPMGQVYQKMGDKYIGRIQKMTPQGQKYFKQFPQFDDTFFDTPNLTQNLTFKANKTINKWNQFVAAQAQLANFLSKVETQQGRRKMVSQYAKTSSIGSDQLRILASLYYYYIDSKSSNSNILQLDSQAVKLLRGQLKASSELSSTYTNVLNIISQSKTKNNQMTKKIQNYHNYKKQSLKASVRDESHFQQMQKLLDDPKAYVPDQMIVMPMMRQSQWYKYLNGQNQFKSKLVVTDWNPNLDWFKPIPYI